MPRLIGADAGVPWQVLETCETCSTSRTPERAFGHMGMIDSLIAEASDSSQHSFRHAFG